MFTILLASTFLEEVGGRMLLTVLVIWWLLSKFLNNNPNVKDAAKKAAANKAIDIISRIFK